MYARVKKRLVNGDIITGSRTNFRPPPGNNRFGDSTRATELPPRLAARSLGIPPQLVILSWLLKFGLSRSGCPVTSTALLPSQTFANDRAVARSLEPVHARTHTHTLVRNFAGWPVGKHSRPPSSFHEPLPIVAALSAVKRGRADNRGKHRARQATIEFQFQTAATARSGKQILSY